MYTIPDFIMLDVCSLSMLFCGLELSHCLFLFPLWAAQAHCGFFAEYALAFRLLDSVVRVFYNIF